MKLAIRFGSTFLFFLLLLPLKAQTDLQQQCLPYNSDRISTFTKSKNVEGGLVKFYNNLNEDITVKIISPGGDESKPRAAYVIKKGMTTEFQVGNEGNSAPLAVTNTSGIFIVFENGEKSCNYLVGEKGVKQLEDKRFFMFKASDFPKNSQSASSPTNSTTSQQNQTLPNKVYTFHQGNFLNFDFYFNNPAQLGAFIKTNSQLDLKIANHNLVLTMPENMSGLADLKGALFNYSSNDFSTSVDVNGWGGLALGNILVTVNSSDGSFYIHVFSETSKSYKSFLSGNLKNYMVRFKKPFTFPDDVYVDVPAFPCENKENPLGLECNGFFGIYVVKEKSISTIYIRGAKVFEGSLPFADKLSNLGLLGKLAVVKFAYFRFFDPYHRGIGKYGEYEYFANIASCPNDKMGIIDNYDNFVTECIYDEIEGFTGNYTRVFIRENNNYHKDYSIIDKSGSNVSGSFSFTVTDPEFEKKKPEKFNCKANLKDGKLDGRFVCNFSNGKKYAEMTFTNGKLVNNTYFIYSKDGKVTHNQVLDGVENYDQFAGMQQEVMVSFMDLLLQGIDSDARDYVEMPGKPEDPDYKDIGM
jgi:major membrane immunogen (membrane-anchored lipoprotein)